VSAAPTHALLVLLALACPGAAAQPAILPCEATDRACAYEALPRLPAKSISFWADAFKRPVEQRIGAAPPGLLTLLWLDVIAQGFPNAPSASTVADDLLSDVRQAFAEIPAPVKRRLARQLAGIYFADDFGGTGFSDVIRDSKGTPVAAFVVLDPSVLRKRTANEWATWKENTPFKPDPRIALTATIEKPADDTRKQAIQYILLHELGHVLSVGSQVHPDWNLAPAKVPQTEQYPFFDLSWFIDRARSRYVTRFDDRFPQRGEVVYYFGARIPASGMGAVYDALERTNFPTLYAATHPGDDFAESVASYVHVVMMGKPFEITISEDGRVAKRYGACWSEARCAEKRRMLEALLR
jgi:hypothetical protein